MKNKGKFITVEGGDGSGKSSVCKLLRKNLPKDKFIYVNDPSNFSDNLREIRYLLLSSEYDYCDDAELLLYGAARAELVCKIIKPSLKIGIHVISDRFFDSTTVYQGKIRGHSKGKLDILNKFFVGDLIPDMTILCDVDAKIGLSRSFSRLEKIENDESRWEKAGLSVHEKINSEYRELSEVNPSRFRVVDSNNLTINEISDITIDHIYNLIKKDNYDR